ncbi:hypothetical protein C5S29_05530 [ANME-1 cluster archaeon GoMg3.2]|nr:hypothetical protein [ANME-1 cluster archaeon GoMg3.2]
MLALDREALAETNEVNNCKRYMMIQNIQIRNLYITKIALHKQHRGMMIAWKYCMMKMWMIAF